MGILEPLRIQKTTPKSPRHNLLKFCVIIIAVLLGIATPLRSSSQAPITFARFSEQMIKGRDIDHVITYKSGDLLIVEVYLKIESLKKPEYADAKKELSAISSGSDEHLPRYTFTAATYQGLVKAINDAETRFGYSEADKISLTIEAAHESLLSNWLAQGAIMILLFILMPLCGYLGYRQGKKRIIGSAAGLLLGLLLGPVGLIVLYCTEKLASQGNGGIRV